MNIIKLKNSKLKNENNTYILMILSCKKYEYKMKEQLQHFDSKGILKNIKYYYLVGDKEKFKNSNKDYLFDKKIIYTNTNDDYLSLPHKVIVGMKALYENLRFDYLLKTDDDQRFVGPLNFFKLLDKKVNEKRPDYFGFSIKCREHKTNNWIHHKEIPRDYLVGDEKIWSNGRFYGLSRRNLKYLLENKFDLIKKELLEDWAIAKYQNLEYRNNFLPIQTDKIFIDMEVYNGRKINMRF